MGEASPKKVRSQSEYSYGSSVVSLCSFYFVERALPIFRDKLLVFVYPDKGKLCKKLPFYFFVTFRKQLANFDPRQTYPIDWIKI